MVKDMTKGSPVKLLLSFAMPLLLGNIFQQLYSVVDAMVLGRGVSVNALAAVGATGTIHFLIFGFITGLTHGYSILISQRFGAEDFAGVRKAVVNSAYLAAASSLVITVISLVFSRSLLQLLHTPEELLEDALVYIRIVFIGIFATVFYNVLGSILRALGDSRSPLVILIASSLVNVGLDILFVIVLQGGIAGAAWATVLAQVVSGLMCLWVLRRMELLRFEAGDAALDGGILLSLVRLGLPVGLMNSITAVGAMLLQSIVNSFGSTTVAAYTASSRIVGLAEQPGSTIGLALGTYVGQNKGAERPDRIRLGVRRAILISLIVNAVISFVMIFFGKQLVAMFVSDAEQTVIEVSYPYLLTAGLLEWSLGLLFIYRFSLQSLGDTVVPMASGALELVIRICAAKLLSEVFHLGFWSICIADVSAWFGAALMLGIAYYIRMSRFDKALSSQPVP